MLLHNQRGIWRQGQGDLDNRRQLIGVIGRQHQGRGLGLLLQGQNTQLLGRREEQFLNGDTV